MANNDIKQRIILEGEQQYKTALQDASRNLKTLRSELKAETAELGKNATEQQKAEVKSKSLTKQIKEQEKVVQTYKDALDEVKEKYGDNEAAVAKWEQKYNEARATLANMKNDLDGVGNSLKNVSTDASMGTVAANSFANAFSGLSTLGSSISDGLENIFSSMAERVRSVAAELWDLIAETAARADAWGDLAGFYGSTAEEVQAMDRAITGAGADFQQFVNFINMLEFKGKDEGLVEWLGISDENYEDKFQFAILAMTELSKKQKELGAGKFNEQLGELFSGKSVGIVELIGEWDRVLEKRQEYEEKGYLLDDQELDTMNKVDNALKDIEDRWNMLKGKFAEGFGQTSLDVMVNVSAGLDALAKYFDAETPEERETAIKEFHDSMVKVFERIAQAVRDGLAILEGLADELKQSEDPIVQGLGNILGGIVSVLEWFTEDNANNFKTALMIVAGAWTTGKVLKMVATIGELAGHIATIKTYQGLNGVLSALGGGAGGGTGTATEAGTTAASTGGGGFWGGTALALTISSIAWAVERRINHKEDVLGTDENLLSKTNGNDVFKSLFAEYVQSQGQWEKYENLEWNATDAELDELQAKISELWGKLQQYDEFNSTWDSYQAWREEHNMGGSDWSLPANWWQTGGADENGITHQDMANFNSMPDKTAAAVSRVVGQIKFEVDGASMGRAVAPYVSEYIAKDIT